MRNVGTQRDRRSVPAPTRAFDRVVADRSAQMEPRDDADGVTRRTVLGGAAAIPAGFALRSGRAAPTATVMTRNLYLGVDLSRLFSARSMDDVRSIAGELLDDIDRHPFGARMDAVAAEIANADVDVVGLQEAALVRTQRSTDSGSDTDEDAENVVVDLQDRLLAALSERGLEFDVAASTVTTDVAFPADTDDGVVDLRYTDRDLVLVRRGLETANSRTGRYEESVSLPIPDSDRELTLQRGYCLVDVTVDGTVVTVASTHLESLSSIPRGEQAAELLDVLPSDGPVVALGDFNTGPATDAGTYDRLTSSLRDAHAERRSGESGYTCCQPPDLRNDQSRLGKRVDAVLYRGPVSSVSARRVGHAPEDRVTARVDGEQVAVWPSDHAGVVATLELSAPTRSGTSVSTDASTATDGGDAPADGTDAPADGADAPTADWTRSPPPDGGRSATRTASDSGPGLGVVSALAGLAAGVQYRLRRNRN